MAVSADGVGAFCWVQLLQHLRDNNAGASWIPQLGDMAQDELVHLPLEYKTIAPTIAPAYRRIAGDHASQEGWAACVMGSDRFKTLVPNKAHREQLTHSAAVFRAPAVVYVTATASEIIAKTLVLVDTHVVEEHVAALEVMAAELLRWMYTGADAKAPSWFPVRDAELMESHQGLWWMLRVCKRACPPDVVSAACVDVGAQQVRTLLSLLPLHATRCCSLVSLLCCAALSGQ